MPRRKPSCRRLADHRLVIVMGTSPEDFFQGVDEAMGKLAQATAVARDAELDQELFRALLALKDEEDRLDQLEKDAELALGEEVSL